MVPDRAGHGGAAAGRAALNATWDGLDAPALARLTGAPRAEVHRSVPSTLDLVHASGAAGAPSGSIALADEQTAGRGRAGRSWSSPAGAGIWLAVLLRPAVMPIGGALSIRAGLAVRAALAVAAPRLPADLKWPNDIVGAGRKLGGILCEARWSGEQLGWIAVGIGLNVHGPLDPALAGAAATVAEFDAEVTRLGVLGELVPRVAALGTHHEPLTDAERADYLRALWMPPGERAIMGLAPDGALLVGAADGSIERRVNSD